MANVSGFIDWQKDESKSIKVSSLERNLEIGVNHKQESIATIKKYRLFAHSLPHCAKILVLGCTHRKQELSGVNHWCEWCELIQIKIDVLSYGQRCEIFSRPSTPTFSGIEFTATTRKHIIHASRRSIPFRFKCQGHEAAPKLV